MGLRFIDLFCGIGGFRVALEQRGLECVLSSDIDEHARKAYKANFGELPSGDIISIPANKIPKHDIICGGFPCQAFSISGKQKGVTDPRGRLFFEILRIAEHHKPMLLLLENVKNILSIDGGSVMRMIEQKLDEKGYTLQAHPHLNASHYGVPQARERVFFVAIRKNFLPSVTYEPPKETLKEVYLSSVLEPAVDADFIINRQDIQIFKREDQVESKLAPIRVGIVNKGGQGERIYSPKGHAITQSAYGGGVGAKTGLYMTEQGIRRLTITECKRVMGFPDSHCVSDGIQGYQQLGNAVIPAMIGAVYDSIRGI